jgi:hypothetical protein
MCSAAVLRCPLQNNQSGCAKPLSDMPATSRARLRVGPDLAVTGFDASLIWGESA